LRNLRYNKRIREVGERDRKKTQGDSKGGETERTGAIYDAHITASPTITITTTFRTQHRSAQGTKKVVEDVGSTPYQTAQDPDTSRFKQCTSRHGDKHTPPLSMPDEKLCHSRVGRTLRIQRRNTVHKCCLSCIRSAVPRGVLLYPEAHQNGFKIKTP
jgi:hypothetical protein